METWGTQKFWEDDVSNGFAKKKVGPCLTNVFQCLIQGFLGCCKLPGKVLEQSPTPHLSSDIKGLQIANSGLFYTRRVPQNQQMVTLKDTMTDCWLAENVFLLKMD